jgi:hypothetical protein
MSLPDAARCRIILLTPPANPADGERLANACSKLFAQFIREGRCDSASCTIEHDGAALVLAWTSDAPLSGCSHDKIHGVLAAHGRDPVPPPFCVQLDGTWRCLARGEFRRTAQVATPLLDHRCERLGDWRAHGLTTVGGSWAAPLLGTP